MLKAALVTDSKLFRDALVEWRNYLAVTHHCDRWIDCQTVVAWASFGQFTFIITLVFENLAQHILENYIPVHVMPDEAPQGFAIFFLKLIQFVFHSARLNYINVFIVTGINAP